MSIKSPFLYALISVVLGFGWQFATVTRNYGGNWTALFCTGSRFPPPSALGGEHIYVFPHTIGYDGQFYHYVAHDPLRQTEVGRTIPDPAIRYKRILLPALAWLVAGGNQSWIDRSYIACNLLFLGFGAWCLARYLTVQNAHPAYSLVYVMVPATLISLDRLTIDLACTSLCVAFLLYTRERADGKLYATLALAGLCRETGLILVAAYVVEQGMARHFRRGLWFATAAIPAAAWSLLVSLQAPGPRTFPLDAVPLRGLLAIQWKPQRYDLPPAARALAVGFDLLAGLGILLAMALSVRAARRRGLGAVEVASLGWAAMAAMLGRDFWADSYCVRVFTPLLLFQAVGWFKGDGAVALAPLLLVAPRIWLQLAPQFLGILAR